MTKLLEPYITTFCRALGLRVVKPWEPIPAVQESGEVRLLWDVSIPTDRVLEHRRPDMTLVLKRSKKILLIEVACAYMIPSWKRERVKRGPSTMSWLLILQISMLVST